MIFDCEFCPQHFFEEEIYKAHMLFAHGFLVPSCSRDNPEITVYDKLRQKHHDLTNEIYRLKKRYETLKKSRRKVTLQYHVKSTDYAKGHPRRKEIETNQLLCSNCYATIQATERELKNLKLLLEQEGIIV